MVKKVFLACLALVLIFTVAACGGDNKDTQATTTKATTTTSAIGTTTTTTGASFDDGTTTAKPTSSQLDMQASLPNDYPDDLFPIYPGSTISQVMEAAGSYTVIAHTDAHHSDVIAFYKNVLKDATPISETEESTSLTSFGTLEDYTYNLDVSENDEYTGFKTQIWLMIY